MVINKLNLKNFRNYDKLNIEFNNGLNIIIGDNAQGKTNILESIYFLSITKSYLPISEKKCMQNDKIFFRIDGIIKSNVDEKKMSLIYNEQTKILKINNKKIKRHSDYIGNLKVILFTPDSIRIIKDAPGNRRRFLNIEISQLHKKYINILNEYNLVLKQRNEYLKIIRNGNKNEIYFDILTDKLIDLAVLIYDYRIKFINDINEYINDIYFEISGYRGLNLKYIPSIEIDNETDIKNILNNKLKKSYEKEIFYGNTLYGPHRDDFIFLLDDNDLLAYGSQGQLKLAILALKLAEINVFKQTSNEYPVLLLDDLFSELDIDKRNKVINHLNKDIQTIITTTDLTNLDSRLVNDAFIYEIENGKIIRQEGSGINERK